MQRFCLPISLGIIAVYGLQLNSWAQQSNAPNYPTTAQNGAGADYAFQNQANSNLGNRQIQARPVSTGQSTQALSVAGQPVTSQSGIATNSVPPGQSPNAGDRIAADQSIISPQAPFEPLSADEQKYVDTVLAIWQQETSKVERLRTDFHRYQYDPSLRTKDHYSYAKGEMKFMAPDKGLFRIDELKFYAGQDEQQKAIFRINERNKFGEYWICDGQYVQILDRNEKKCTKVELPPNMRGQQIYMSPLPFLFGVNANDIKNRFWIRPLQTPKGRKDEVWLEAFPKTAADAQNYSRVQIVLDSKKVLPNGLIVFLPNWRPDANHQELYEFADREINPNSFALNPFAKAFIPDQLPKDWTVIVEPFQAQPVSQPQQAQGTSPARVAQPGQSPAVPVR